MPEIRNTKENLTDEHAFGIFLKKIEIFLKIEKNFHLIVKSINKRKQIIKLIFTIDKILDKFCWNI